MVTRRTRNFKEKSTASNILGRLIMPVAVVMALALFYFSIKLFFFSPPREERHPLPSTVTPPAVTEPYEGGDDYGDELPPIDDMDDTSTITPETPPAEQKPEPAEDREAGRKAEARGDEARPEACGKAEAETGSDAAAEAVAVLRAEVGRADRRVPRAFRRGADGEAGARKGLFCYVVDEKLDGKPFYKVRVRGHADKNEARALSQKLAAAGFPSTSSP